MAEQMTRRELIGLAGAAALALPSSRSGIFVCMHEATSTPFDFRAAMEGYSRAGVRAVEVMLTKVREFSEKNSVAAARRVLDDLGLRAVSTSNQLGLAEPNPARSKNLEELRWKCELAQALGCDRLVAPTLTREAFTPDDYKRGVDNLREAGEIARPYKVTLMVEFTRLSTFAGTLSTALQLVRNANHPNVRVMMDTYHFWGGVSKFEDLELLREGELHHLHFEDVPADPPREQLEQRHRVLPGQGIAPMRRILDVLRRKKYAGPASVEMFDPAIQSADPYAVAAKARAAVEALTG
jgi:sugar phosphate isomerase/epimerase